MALSKTSSSTKTRSVRNKPIMIYLHENKEEYDPDGGASLLVNLGSLDAFHDVRLCLAACLPACLPAWPPACMRACVL